MSRADEMIAGTQNSAAALAAEGLNAQPILEVRDLTMRFPVGRRIRPQYLHAVNGVSFEVRQREIVALVGESGSGKSTTARIIVRLLKPSGGKIFFDGVDVLETEPRSASREFRRRVQMIFQDPFGSLSPNHTIGFQLARPVIIHRKARVREAVRQKVFDVLETVGLEASDEMWKKFPFELSGGQRQRVAIARALAVEPEVILADEPVSMLDVSVRMGILNLMAELKESKGISILYITHDLASARYLADRTMVMYAGYIVESGESLDLMDNPQHPYTQLLISAVPNPYADSGMRTFQARGEIPSLIDPPPGCPFAPRCPHVMGICREYMPRRSTLGKDRWLRCHLFKPDDKD